MKFFLFTNICYIFVSIFSEHSFAANTLNLSQSLTFNETLISSQNRFQLGFFSPGNSKKFYLGTWYNTPTKRIVWIANRNNPLNESFGVLSIGSDGNLILLDKEERIIWSTNIQNKSINITVAQLSDTGNLVLMDAKENTSILWRSFDHLTHAITPGMKLGKNLRSGLDFNLTSWKSPDDPSRGDYTYVLDVQGLSQFIILKGPLRRYRRGVSETMEGLYGSGVSLPYIVKVIKTSEEVYYEYSSNDNTTLAMTSINYYGQIEIAVYDNNTNDWRVLIALPQNNCDNYGVCGTNSVCDINADPTCICLTGYVRNSLDRCVQENPFECSQTGYFIEYLGFQLPDFLEFSMITNTSMDQCKDECLKNCSCTAYAIADDETGLRNVCIVWFGELNDVRKLTMSPRQNLYIRIPASNLDSGSKKLKKALTIVGIIVASLLLLFTVLFIIWKRKSHLEDRRQGSRVGDKESPELPYFDILTVNRATENFSSMNKIGEGGFGAVYKGKLPSGQEIAVKRHSENSSQGANEFKNEVLLIAKLQHRNLIRLLGYCIHREEKMLIYEYMPNRSLDGYIFGGSENDKNHLLAWRRRFSIILGISRGLLYLHQDSRLKIIHRDLKTSNVLLDNEMNPKISDFGTARIFGDQQSTKKTKMVVGTFGYMAPEYAMRGVFSMKSDIFSFGVLVLEIVSGKRNNYQYIYLDQEFNLLGLAWKLWSEGKANDLIDSFMDESFPVSEVLRCIHVGLLCVQQRPEDRPTISSVLLMLDSENAILPQPERPGYYTERVFHENGSQSDDRLQTINEMTNTTIQGR